jgi:membrane associated rhomboid family serine protease
MSQPKANILRANRLSSHPSFLPLHGLNKLRLKCRSALGSSSAKCIAIGATTAASAGPLFSGGVSAFGNNKNSGRPFSDPSRRITDILLATNVLLFGLQVLTNQAVTLLGIKVNSLIIAGQYWRLLTPAFLHGNLIHLAVNSASLNNLGPVLEASTGPYRYVVVYLTAALGGTIASFLGSKAPSLGASGAIFGVGGAIAVYFYRNKDIFGQKSDYVLNQLWRTLLINLGYGMLNSRIDNWGHLGGMVGGALAAYLLGPAYKLVKFPGNNGVWLVDKPPLPFLKGESRQISRR